MKKLLLSTIVLLIGFSLFAQTPESFTYQAVLRNSDGSIIANQPATVIVEILQGSTTGTSVFTEIHNIVTSAEGIINLTIGSKEDLSVINWADDEHFMKVTINGVVLGVTQMFSVPYALHAKTADNLSESFAETDPVFSAWDKSTGIEITESQVIDLQNYLTTETDPVFATSVAKGITPADTASWNEKLDEYTESDPIYSASVASGITSADTSKWNITQGEFNETDPVFTAWNKTTGISITESQISDLQSYLTSESDPQVAAKFDFTGATTGDLLRFNGIKWVKVTPNYLTSFTEEDPEFYASPASGIVSGDVGNWNSAYGWGNHAEAGYAVGDPSFFGNLTSTSYQLQVIHPSLNFKGRIFDDQNHPHGGVHSITFKLFNLETGGTQLWSETQSVAISNGYFDALLGEHSPISNAILSDNSKVYIQVQLNAEDFSPRVLLYNDGKSLVAEYSTKSGTTDEVAWGNITSNPFSITTPQDGDLLKYNSTSQKWEKFTPDYASTTHVHSIATTENAGFMSADDKTKIDGFENVNLSPGAGISITGTYPDLTVSSSDTLYLGQEYLDGIIFYLYIGSDGQQHGLVVSKTETTAKWQNTEVLVNADRTEDGDYNTGLMTDSPAKTWVTGLGAGWYLPSIDELSLLWHNRFHVNKTARAIGTTLLSTTASYWSSTESSATNAFYFHFTYGYTDPNNKTITSSVRAVGAF